LGGFLNWVPGRSPKELKPRISAALRGDFRVAVLAKMDIILRRAANEGVTAEEKID
jgi:hypothetical protein